jgi:two-component system, OmpR family, phosphate regulon sensor histidine kinase PhoR
VKRTNYLPIAILVGSAALLAAGAFLTMFGIVATTATNAFLLGGLLSGLGAFYGQALVRQKDRAYRDEHERAQVLEADLRQQKEAVDNLADGLEIAIFICDRKGLIGYANRRAREIFKFENPVGRTILAVTLSYDLESLVLEAFRTGEKQTGEVPFAYPEERTALAEGWLDSGGQRLFLSLYEITDLRRLERIRQDFVANVSHELRTPLASIRAMAETLLDEAAESDELGRRYLDKIVSEVDRLSLIANDLLILSAAESNPVRKQACNIAEVIQAVIHQLEPKASQKGLKLTYRGPRDLIIEANSSQMSQVAMNLVDNAINYTFEGHIEVTLKVERDHVDLTVQDTGIGIASEHLPRVFERFYRVDKGRSRATGGTGLGLSIVKHIVEAHGGEVRLESTLNQGTTFTASIPKGDLSVNVSEV